MNKLLVLVGCLSLVACATSEPDFTQTEFAPLDHIELKANLPARPKAKAIGEYAAFDLDGMNQLNTYTKQAEANTEALQSLVYTHNKLIEQRNLLTTMISQQESRSNLYSKLYTETKNELNSERRYNAIERIFLQLMLFGAAL